MIYKDFDIKVCKKQEDDDFFTFSGMASTDDVDRDNDIVLPTAFGKSINEPKPILFNHDSSQPVGKTTSMSVLDNGLYIEARMPKNDQFVKSRMIPQMKGGSLNKMSIGFLPNFKDIDYREDGVTVFKDVELLEISLVTIPANNNANITTMKKLSIEDVNEIKSKREFENVLRESNVFSKSACVYLSSLCSFESESQKELEQEILKSLSKLEH